MPIMQSEMARRRETPPTAYVSGARMVAISSFTFTAAFTAAADKLELGMLPAGARVVGASLIGENMGAVNAVAGLMSGEPGDPNDARTVGSQLFAATSVQTAAVSATTLACLTIAPSNVHRAIGVTLSANITAAANKKLTLVLEYVF